MPGPTPGSCWRRRSDDARREGTRARRRRSRGRHRRARRSRRGSGRRSSSTTWTRCRRASRRSARRCRRRSTSRSPSRPTRCSPSSSTCAAWASGRTSRPAVSCGTSCAPASSRPASSSPGPGSATRSSRPPWTPGSAWSRSSHAASSAGWPRSPRPRAGCSRSSSGCRRVADADAERVRIIGDAGAGKFGMDEADLRAAATEAVASPWLEPWGVHAFGASNLLDADGARRRTSRRRSSSRPSVAARGRLPAPPGRCRGRARDPVPRRRAAARPGRAGRRLWRRSRTGWRRTPPRHGARVLLEPGRWLVGPAGAYVTRVVDRKRVGQSEVAILDGGIHHVLRPVLVGQPHRVVAVTGDAARCAGGCGHARGSAVHRPRHPRPGRAAWRARRRRPRRRARRGGVRRHRVDAAVPQPRHARRGRRPRRHGAPGPPAARARDMAGPPPRPAGPGGPAGS